MIKKSIFVSAVFAAVLLQVSCGDFVNKPKNTSNDVATNPWAPVGENPFAADFDPNSGSFMEEKMLANVGLNIIQPATKKFRLRTEVLENHLNEMVMKDVRSTSALNELQLEWKRAMLAFHEILTAPVGPLSENQNQLSQNIYSWPYFSACRIDLEVEKFARAKVKNPNLLVSQKGLAALEYLFFEQSLMTACPPANPSNRPAVEWSQKPADEKLSDRLKFAQYLMEDLLLHAKRLEALWDQNQGNYSKSFIDGSKFSSTKQAVNHLTDALFSIEAAKDVKLGKPLGFHKDCLNPSGACAEMSEHFWSKISLESIETQFTTFQRIFNGTKQDGTAGFGLDDYLEAVGRKDVSDNMKVKMAVLVPALQRLHEHGDLQSQIQVLNVSECRQSTSQDRRVEICAVYQDVRGLTTLLKTDFLLALSLSAPPVFQGDND